MDISLSTGIMALDKVIRGLRPGDNLVYQVDSIEDYIPFVYSFCYDADKHQRKLVYFRFATHRALIPEDVNAKIFHIDPANGFESFIDEVFKVIEDFGLGVCYVFDCLSELTEAWCSDWMLGNFFLLTCPYLYRLKTGTYFGMIRNQHSTQTMDAIHQTAQIVFNIYRKDDQIYLHPLKVWNRYSKTMYMLHRWVGDTFEPVMNSAVTSEILANQSKPWVDFTSTIQDVWTRTFSSAQHIFELPEWKRDITELNIIYKKLIRMTVTREPFLLKLANTYLELGEVLRIGRRMIGTGLVGGKAAGMLIAQAILKRINPDKYKQLLEIQDCYYIGSDVFYTYLVQNHIWWERRTLKTTHHNSESNWREIASNIQAKILKGQFPAEINFQFKKMLEYFGQSPIIIRSSSLMEDAFHNSFSGKYDSVFLANQGSPEERFKQFTEAVKKVYASTMNEKALTYREKRGLLDKDEQMSILIMRVSGSFYGDLFYPHVAGVGYSYNPFVWDEKIDPEAGMLRLVFGLGTRAVEKIDDDYTRIVALNIPHLLPTLEGSETRRYTQHRVDILDLSKNDLVSNSFENLMKANVSIPIEIFTSIDEDLRRHYEAQDRSDGFFLTLTFDKLLRSHFTADMKDVLRILAKVYESPVDIEFTANFDTIDDYRINLLQCRTFQFHNSSKSIQIPDHIPQERLIFQTSGPIIGESAVNVIDRVIYIVPDIYGKLPQSDRYSIARLIGKLNRLNDDEQRTLMIISPGRLGSTSPSLGLTTTFIEINNFSILCEIAEMHEGLIPAVSLGTHFFNDLVEHKMLYLAIHPKRNDLFNKKLLNTFPNQLSKLLPNVEKYDAVLKVIDLQQSNDGLRFQLNSDTIRQKAVFYLDAIP